MIAHAQQHARAGEQQQAQDHAARSRPSLFAQRQQHKSRQRHHTDQGTHQGDGDE